MYDNFGYDSTNINKSFRIISSLFNVDFTGLGENMHSNIFVFI